MNAFVIDPTSGGASSSSTGGGAANAYSHHHQRWPTGSSHPDPPNVEWRQDNNIGVSHDEDAMCVEEGSSQVVETRCHRWNPVSLHVLDAELEDNRPVEWVPLSDDDEDENGNIQESVVRAPSTSLMRYHSRTPNTSSASTSLNSLGLHHPTPSPVTPVDTTHYDRTSFASNSIGVQAELSELDITQISPLSGNPLINWHSPPGFSYYTTTIGEDEIESLIGQKRPREGESEDSDNLVNGCKRRRRRGLWMAA